MKAYGCFLRLAYLGHIEVVQLWRFVVEVYLTDLAKFGNTKLKQDT